MKYLNFYFLIISLTLISYLTQGLKDDPQNKFAYKKSNTESKLTDDVPTSFNTSSTVNPITNKSNANKIYRRARVRNLDDENSKQTQTKPPLLDSRSHTVYDKLMRRLSSIFPSNVLKIMGLNRSNNKQESTDSTSNPSHMHHKSRESRQKAIATNPETPKKKKSKGSKTKIVSNEKGEPYENEELSREKGEQTYADLKLESKSENHDRRDQAKKKTAKVNYKNFRPNQRFNLPECATQQVCNAVFVRLNYTQPLCACPTMSDPCSASSFSNDRHTIELRMKGANPRAVTLAKTCEPVETVRDCRQPRDWAILALQNTRTGKAHYLVICRCPDPSMLEGPLVHDQPTYAQVPGIRVYGMMCNSNNRYKRHTDEDPDYLPKLDWAEIKSKITQRNNLNDFIHHSNSVYA